MSDALLSLEYKEWLNRLKVKVVGAQIRASLAANRELILFYWALGKEISLAVDNYSWGQKVITQLSKDLREAFPDITGFSRTNLYYIKKFYDFFNAFALEALFVPQVEGQIEKTIVPQSEGQSKIPTLVSKVAGYLPWGHIKIILDKVKEYNEVEFYIDQSVENGWSRDVLALQIKSDLYSRAGSAITNFNATLPSPQSDLAQQVLKDPYNFDFLAMTIPYNERDIEKQLVDHITTFLLELGKGFAFVGKQYNIEVAGNDYFIDLLFYHIKLKCYVVIELKNTKFKPEYAGKLNFYLSAVDDLVKEESDNETIGMILCRDKNSIETEFALRGINRPMGVSEFSLTEIIPEELKGSLPTVEEIERGLSKK